MIKKTSDVEEVKEEQITLDQLLTYLHRDLTYLEGMADGIGHALMKTKIFSIKSNLRLFENGKQ